MSKIVVFLLLACITLTLLVLVFYLLGTLRLERQAKLIFPVQTLANKSILNKSTKQLLSITENPRDKVVFFNQPIPSSLRYSFSRNGVPVYAFDFSEEDHSTTFYVYVDEARLEDEEVTDAYILQLARAITAQKIDSNYLETAKKIFLSVK